MTAERDLCAGRGGCQQEHLVVRGYFHSDECIVWHKPGVLLDLDTRGKPCLSRVPLLKVLTVTQLHLQLGAGKCCAPTGRYDCACAMQGYEWSKFPALSKQWSDARDDMLAAHSAWKGSKWAFKLATAGWTLGPMEDPSWLDGQLPADFEALSGLVGRVGRDNVQPGYAKCTKHKTWVSKRTIPSFVME